MLPKFHMIRDTQTRSCGIVVTFLVDIITKEAIELRVRFKFGSLIRRKGNEAGIVKDKTEEQSKGWSCNSLNADLF